MSARRSITTILVALSALAGCLAVAGASALAAPYSPSGSFGAEEPDNVAVETSSGDLFVTDPEASKVLKLGPEGKVEGEITGLETPQGKLGLSSFHGVAVDNSSSSSKEDVYIASDAEAAVSEGRPVVDKFAPKAGKPNEYEYVCELVGVGGGCHKEAEKEGVTPTSAFAGFGAPLGVAAGATGQVYVEDYDDGEPQVYEFGPTGEDVTGSPLSVTMNASVPFGIAVDAADDIYVVGFSGNLEGEEVVKINTQGETSVLEQGGAKAVAVNSTSGEVFVVSTEGGNHVIRYDSTGKEIERFGAGEVGEANGIAYSAKNNDVYVTDTDKDEIHVFAASSVGEAPEVTCTETAPARLLPKSATLTCTVDPKGEEADWKFEYKEATATEFTSTPEGTIAASGAVEATIEGLRPQTEYDYRLTAHNKHGAVESALETFTTPPAVAGVTSCATQAQAETATFEALLEPAGVLTEYRFQYGASTSYGSETKAQKSASASAVSASQAIEGLEPNRDYDCRLVASDAEGVTDGANGTFTTKALPPKIVSQLATDVESTSVQVQATIDPENSASTYYMEYVQAAQYHPAAADPYEEGVETPTPEGAIGSDLGYHAVAQVLDGLTPGTRYDFRVVASNSPAPGTGTSYGEDETFTTHAVNAPVVVTGTASDVSQNGATLSGTVDPEGYATSYVFEVGTSTEYGTDISDTLSATGTEAQSVTLALENLAPDTTYYYRLSATNANSVNGRSRGEPGGMFTTSGNIYSLTLPLTAPLIAVPTIFFPTGNQENTTKTETKKLTRAQKLAKALKACSKKQNKRKRAACERQAREQYSVKGDKKK